MWAIDPKAFGTKCFGFAMNLVKQRWFRLVIKIEIGWKALKLGKRLELLNLWGKVYCVIGVNTSNFQVKLSGAVSNSTQSF